MKKEKRLEIRLNKDERLKLDALARQEGVRVSELIRLWINKTPLLREHKERACELKLRGCTGKAETSTDRGWGCYNCIGYDLVYSLRPSELPSWTLLRGNRTKDEQWEIAKAAIAAGDDPHEAIRGK